MNQKNKNVNLIDSYSYVQANTHTERGYILGKEQGIENVGNSSYGYANNQIVLLNSASGFSLSRAPLNSQCVYCV